jgi:hypothetical protein
MPGDVLSMEGLSIAPAQSTELTGGAARESVV